MKNFLVTDGFFYDEEKYVLSYNLFISHALFYVLKNKIYTAKDTITFLQEILKEINDIIDEKTKPHGLTYKKFLKVYPFLNEKLKIGIIIVDQTGGCYPLILYQSHKDHALRVSGFCASLREIIKGANILVPIIESAISARRDWDKPLEEKLKKKFKPIIHKPH